MHTSIHDGPISPKPWAEPLRIRARLRLGSGHGLRKEHECDVLQEWRLESETRDGALNVVLDGHLCIVNGLPDAEIILLAKLAVAVFG
jgi:hypothetical protein